MASPTFHQTIPIQIIIREKRESVCSHILMNTKYCFMSKGNIRSVVRSDS